MHFRGRLIDESLAVQRMAWRSFVAKARGDGARDGAGGTGRRRRR